jgi:AcrR family transcriptional regulator
MTESEMPGDDSDGRQVAEAGEAAGAGEAGLGVRSAGPHSLHPTASKILEAARKVLLERGHQGMTLQAIAAEAEVNKAGVWYYFGGKEPLVLALLEDITVGESLHFGTLQSADAGLEERVDLLIGTEEELRARVRRFRAIYELLPEASRDEELRKHLMTYYRAWYEWAAAVLAPAVDASGPDRPEPGGGAPKSAELGQFASLLLDGIIMQVVVGAGEFNLTAALANARRALLQAARDAAGERA